MEFSWNPLAPSRAWRATAAVGTSGRAGRGKAEHCSSGADLTRPGCRDRRVSSARAALERRQRGERVAAAVERRLVVDDGARQRLRADARDAAPAAARAAARLRSARAGRAPASAPARRPRFRRRAAAAASSPCDEEEAALDLRAAPSTGCRQRWHSSVTSASARQMQPGCAGAARAPRRSPRACQATPPRAVPSAGASVAAARRGRRSSGQRPSSSPPAAANARDVEPHADRSHASGHRAQCSGAAAASRDDGTMTRCPPAASILASTSRYRRELLERLRLPFDVRRAAGRRDAAAPAKRRPRLAQRLALAKARRRRRRRIRDAVVIGSDQVADLDGAPIGKPGDHERAVAQLRAMRGRSVVFQTAVAVVCARRAASPARRWCR